MNGVSVAQSGRIVRFVLLAATLVGLTAMHSLGHQPAISMSHAGPGMRTVTTHTIVMPAAAPITAAADACADEACAYLILDEGGSPGHMPGWAVCMAVVGAFGIALALAAALLLRWTTARPGNRRWSSVTASRDPPAVPRMGQRVATVSVLRI